MRFFRIFRGFLYTLTVSCDSQEKMVRWCCVPFLFFFRVYRPNGTPAPSKLPICQTLETYPDPNPAEFGTPCSYQILENT